MSWGPTGAEGTGIEQIQNCNPNCAQGEIFRNQVQVLFTGATAAPAGSGCSTDYRYYTQLIVAYPDLTTVPNDGRGGTVTTYNGMPAVRFNNLEVICNSPQA
jgi:hypothetical protein